MTYRPSFNRAELDRARAQAEADRLACLAGDAERQRVQGEPVHPCVCEAKDLGQSAVGRLQGADLARLQAQLRGRFK